MGSRKTHNIMSLAYLLPNLSIQANSIQEKETKVIAQECVALRALAQLACREILGNPTLSFDGLISDPSNKGSWETEGRVLRELLALFIQSTKTPDQYGLYDVHGDGRCGLYAITKVVGRELTPRPHPSAPGEPTDLNYLSADIKRSGNYKMFKELFEKGVWKNVGDPLSALANAQETRTLLRDRGFKYIVIMLVPHFKAEQVAKVKKLLNETDAWLQDSTADDQIYAFDENAKLSLVFGCYQNNKKQISDETKRDIKQKIVEGQVVAFVSNAVHWRVALPVRLGGTIESFDTTL